MELFHKNNMWEPFFWIRVLSYDTSPCHRTPLSPVWSTSCRVSTWSISSPPAPPPLPPGPPRPRTAGLDTGDSEPGLRGTGHQDPRFWKTDLQNKFYLANFHVTLTIWNQYPLGQEPGGSAPCVSDPSSASSWWRWRRSWRRCKASQGSRRRCRWPDSPSPLDSHHSFHALLILVIKRFIICLNFSRVSPSSVFQFLVPGNNEQCRRSRAAGTGPGPALLQQLCFQWFCRFIIPIPALPLPAQSSIQGTIQSHF